MPFCKVYKNTVGEDYYSFDGYFRDGGDTIYAAIKTDSPELEDYRSLEPFDVRGGRALYEMSDYLAIDVVDTPEHYDIAIYQHTDQLHGRELYGLYGYVETKSGKIVTPAQYSDAKPFLSQKYAKASYPDGRIEFIDTEGQVHQLDEDLLTIDD